ncbi:glycosyltransferase family 4 protein [Effusibacillus consociatus]|uniref:Glycosyltransferase family 4 protein n=1 Tax=Effusibacillus consociatus TaxID=1117041 RepID=A0ABV9Q243_9BACL
MRILLATFWVLPHVGGVNTYLQVLKKGLEERGHKVDILGTHPGMNHVHLITDNRRVKKQDILFTLNDTMVDYFQQELPGVDNWVSHRYIERQVFELASALIGINDYDVIHTQDVISTRTFSRIIPKKTPLVATIHGLLMDEFFTTGEITQEDSMRWKYSFVEEHLGASSAAVTILPTEWLRREHINRFFVSPEKLTVIPYGLNTEPYIREAEAIERTPRTDGKMVIICPARLVPYKGQRYLLEALAELIKVRDDFVCRFAGGGQQRAELEQITQQLNLQNHVQFLGNRNDILYLLKQADLFVLPSLVENHSLAVMEAQLLELPVITTRVGGNTELVTHLHTGILVEPRNSQELYQAILMLMNDPDLRNKLCINSKKWARKYWHPNRMVERTLDVYKEVMDKYK